MKTNNAVNTWGDKASAVNEKLKPNAQTQVDDAMKAMFVI